MNHFNLINQGLSRNLGDSAIFVNDGIPVVYSIFRDNLGSFTHLKNGSNVQEFSYDAYGNPRNPANWEYGGSTAFGRGFTGHEHLEDFHGLINMNGRLYDPQVGRFLSPDNYVQSPDFTQSYNRYNYCLNNPLKYTDPSGKFFKEILAAIGIITYPIAFITSIPGSIASGSNIFSQPNSWYTGLKTTGTSFDNAIFGKSNSSVKVSNTGQPGYNGTSYTYNYCGQSYNGYYFDNFSSMTNYMWNTSNSPSINVEISGYILQDNQGNYSYWVNDWAGNTNSSSSNPYFKDPTKLGVATFDGKKIVGEVHTHPTSYYSSVAGYTDGYDGPSYLDYLFSKAINAPVYTIGPTSVSMITPSSKITTQADFNQIASGRYPNPLAADKNTNPFAIIDRDSWLRNPNFYKIWW